MSSTMSEENMLSRLSVETHHGDSFLGPHFSRGRAAKLCQAVTDHLESLTRKGDPAPARDILRKRVMSHQCRKANTFKELMIPLPALREALKVNLVEAMLRDLGVPRPEARCQADEIVSAYPRVLGILLRLKKSDAILDFVKNGLDDRHLPLKTTREMNSFDRGDERVCITTWKDSDDNEYEDFCKHQNTFMTPFFAMPDRKPRHYELGISEQYLPITDQEENINIRGADGTLDNSSIQDIIPDEGGGNEGGEGAQGVVNAVKLDPLSYDFGDFPYQHKDGWFAMKARKPNTSMLSFLREAITGSFFSQKGTGSGSLRICPLLCSFQTPRGLNLGSRPNFYLLFPLATGPLPTLWSRYPGGGGIGEVNAQWLARELFCLTETLSHIHHDYVAADPTQPNYGRIGDIKPENILWFADHVQCRGAGCLLFNDFGCSKIHRAWTKSNSFPPETARTATYMAPEFIYLVNTSVDGKSSGIGRKADIWSLGCTLLEFLTWYMMGHKPVAKGSKLCPELRRWYARTTVEGRKPLDIFSDIREQADHETPMYKHDRFFCVQRVDDNTPSLIINPGVTSWMQLLHKSESCTPFLHDLLSIIQRSMLRIRREDRKTAREIAQDLGELRKKLGRDPDLGFKRRPCSNCPDAKTEIDPPLPLPAPKA